MGTLNENCTYVSKPLEALFHFYLNCCTLQYIFFFFFFLLHPAVAQRSWEVYLYSSPLIFPVHPCDLVCVSYTSDS